MGCFTQQLNLFDDFESGTEKPKIIVWENVCGAFSSNKGLDFRAVLEEIAETEIPMPDAGRWADAGMAELPKCQICWRVFDAQYWGVPQRRKRIFLVADFGGRRAAEILFKPESLPRDTAAGRATEKEAAARTGCGAADDGDDVKVFQTTTRPHSKDEAPTWKEAEVANTLNAFDVGEARAKELVVKANCLTPWDAQSKRIMSPNGIAPTLNGREGHGGEPGIVAVGFDTNASSSNNAPVLDEAAPPLKTTNRIAVCEIHGQDSKPLSVSENVRAELRLSEKTDALTNGGGKPGQGFPCILCLNDQGGRQMSVSKDVCATLRAQEHSHQPLVLAGNQPNVKTFVIEGNGSRPSHKGDGYSESDVMYTLNTIDKHAVCLAEKATPDKENKAATIRNAAGFIYKAGAKTRDVGYAEETAPTLSTDGKHGVCYSIGHDFRSSCFEPNVTDPLVATDYKDPPKVAYSVNDDDSKVFGIGRDVFNSGKNAKFGLGIAENVQPTLVAKGCGAVAYGFSSYASNAMKSDNPHSGIYEAETSRTLDQSGGNPACNQGGIAVLDCRNMRAGTTSGTLQAKANGGYSLNYQNPVYARSVLRRLTPLECERLQGYPDGWTDGISDTARYRALGNSVAVPCVEFIFQRISEIFNTEKERLA